MTMRFKMTHQVFNTEKWFTETDAPDWLTGKKTIKGSTMDTRWFWTGHVLTLNVGQSVDTDFQTVTRVN